MGQSAEGKSEKVKKVKSEEKREECSVLRNVLTLMETLVGVFGQPATLA